MTQEEEIRRLKKQLSELVERFSEVVEHLSKTQERESQLLAQVSALQAENQVLQEQLAVAQKRIEELEKQKTPPPAFVKANVVKPAEEEKKQRKKRAAQYTHARRREAPTQLVEHRIKHCPVCANALGGISVVRRRQVIELPPSPPVEVTEHVVYHGWCSQCGT
jgi:DNA repair exonuclease SbcCD ATPase subunit